jgi:hypothetical protein
MKKRKLFGIAGVLAVLLALGVILVGCATTAQVTFAAGEAPQGELKYTVIRATTMGNNSAFPELLRGDPHEGNISVLQRFYAEYPHEKYQIVACELVSKSWLPVVTVMGGALLGTAIGLPAAMDSDNLASGMGVGFGVPAVGASIGLLVGNYFQFDYIVTYVEK